MTWGGVAEVERLGSTRLERWSGAGWTTLRVRTTPHSSIGWVVVGAYTSRAELRQVVSVENRDITVAALTYYHDPDEIVLALDDPTVNVRWFGALGDGVTDDTAAIQAAIDAANALYTTHNNTTRVYFPYAANGYLVSSITLKSGVELYAHSGHHSLGTFLTSTTPGFVIDTPDTKIDAAGVNGLGVVGGGTPATNGLGGIRLKDIHKVWIKNTFLRFFANQGILILAGGSGLFENILIYQALMNRSRDAVAGAFEIYGTDHQLNNIEATTSQSIEGTVTDANLYLAGILIGSHTGFIRSCVGEISDIGIYVSGIYNRFSDCRADHNYGHGWFFEEGIAGAYSQVDNCTAQNNSQDTTNTYDGFHVDGTNGNSAIFSNCAALSLPDVTKKHRYGFYDLTSSVNGANRYIACKSIGHATAIIALHASEYAPSTFEISGGTRGVGFTDGDTTPSVAGASMWDTANTNPTTITNFDDGIDGQIIRIKADANTTIQHGTNIFTTSGSNITCAANVIYSFQKRRTKWYQL